MGLGLLYVTHPNEKDAETLCDSLLDEELIACANFFPINSIFNWENEKTKENEVVSLIKFNKNKIDEIEKRIKELHSYEVPCIIRISATANNEFEKWINNQ
ncbi:MAG: divalent-cation tolerance protein CutA [Euryarchaeota archaeon]|nr:divalent-cation tolerance protein CutA [Euryarchaeota archaeon]|tara:strand:- start:815 stop:1117 length:303 start_codon:yes stop_codon:yes gene_type:complete